jgi:hypothetical protein
VQTVSYVGGFAVAGGVVDPGREHVALKLKELADKGEIAVSFGFYGLRGPDGVYHLYRPFELSPLPVGSEANPLTSIDLATATKENGMPFSDKKKAWLKEHFRMDDAAVSAAEAAFEKMGAAVKAAGIDYKEADEAPVNSVPPAPAPPPTPGPPVESGPNPLVDIANAVKALGEQVVAMQSDLKAYKEGDAKTVTERAQDQVMARVAAAAAGGFRPTQTVGNVVPGAKDAGDDWFSAALGGVFNMDAFNGGGAVLAPTTAPAQNGGVS